MWIQEGLQALLLQEAGVRMRERLLNTMNIITKGESVAPTLRRLL